MKPSLTDIWHDNVSYYNRGTRTHKKKATHTHTHYLELQLRKQSAGPPETPILLSFSLVSGMKGM